MPTQLIAADACSLVNLLATGFERPLLDALEYSLMVPTQIAGQIQCLWTPPDPDGNRKRVATSASHLCDAGVLQTVTLSSCAELDALVEAAAEIDDADAACIALAGVRRLPLLTDDRKERRIAERMFPGIRLLSTLQVVHDGLVKLALGEHQVADVAANLYWRGNFAPPRLDPLAEWYRKALAQHLPCTVR